MNNQELEDAFNQRKKVRYTGKTLTFWKDKELIVGSLTKSCNIANVIDLTQPRYKRSVWIKAEDLEVID